MFQISANDENCDPSFSKQKKLSRSRPNSSLTPSLRRGIHQSQSISPLRVKSRGNDNLLKSTPRSDSPLSIRKPTSYNGVSRPNTTNSVLSVHIPKTPELSEPEYSFAINDSIEIKKSRDWVASGKEIEAMVAVIGDSKCGKTRLVSKYLSTFNKPGNPIEMEQSFNIFDSHDITTYVRDYEKMVNIKIYDFPGDDTFNRIRPKFYVSSSFVLICFNFRDYEIAMNNIKEIWIPEVENYCGLEVVKFIIGIDRDDKTARSLKTPPFNFFYKFAKELNCKYLECHLDDTGSIERLFDIIATLKAKQEFEKSCKGYKLNGFTVKSGKFNSGNKRFNRRMNSDILYLDSNSNDDIDNVDDQELDPQLTFGGVGYRKTSYQRKNRSCIVM